jgi:ABC-type uncharacterized transport system substrate-binding protein
MFANRMKHSIRVLAFVLTGLFWLPLSAAAHPHVWVTMNSSVVYDDKGEVTGVRHKWVFDDMYSAFAIQGLDQKVKGQFTSQELEPLAKVNVESLKEYDFFTFGKADGKELAFTDPKDYHLEFNSKDTVLTLHFVLPLKKPVKANALVLDVFDPEYFIDFEWAEKSPAGLENAPASCKMSVEKPKELTADMVRKLAEIPADGKIPAGSYGAAFANKINVKCP